MYKYTSYFGGETVQETCFRKLKVFSSTKQVILKSESSHCVGEKLPFDGYGYYYVVITRHK